MEYVFSKDYFNNQDKELMMNFSDNEQNYSLGQQHLQNHMYPMQFQTLSNSKHNDFAACQQQQQYLTHEMEQRQLNMEQNQLQNIKEINQSYSTGQPLKKASNIRNNKRQPSSSSSSSAIQKPLSNVASKENLSEQNISQQSMHLHAQQQPQAQKSKGGNSKQSLTQQRNHNNNKQNNDSEAQVGQNQVIPEEQNFNYYHEFCRLFTANVVLTNQLKELVGQKTDLVSKFTKLEKKTEELGDQDADDRKKRFRRIASQIDRHYKCPNTTCQKSYGSEGSLNQHLKIKHPELYQGGPTNSEMDSEQNNNFYNNNLESFQDYQNEEDEEENDEEDEEEEENQDNRQGQENQQKQLRQLSSNRSQNRKKK